MTQHWTKPNEQSIKVYALTGLDIFRQRSTLGTPGNKPRLPAPAVPSTVMRRQGPRTQSPPPNSPGHTASRKQRSNLVCIPSLYHYQVQFEAMSVTGLIVHPREI